MSAPFFSSGSSQRTPVNAVIAAPLSNGAATHLPPPMADGQSLCEPADLEDFFENGAIALHLVAADGKILKANKAELEFLGYAPEE